VKYKQIVAVVALLLGILAMLGTCQVALAEVPVRTLLDTSDVYPVAFSPDGKAVAFGWVNSNTIKLRSLVEGREIMTLPGVAQSITAVAFGWVNSNTIKLRSLVEGREIMTLPGVAQSITAVAFSLDGKTLASASGDKLWDVFGNSSGNILTFLRVPPQPAPPPTVTPQPTPTVNANVADHAKVLVWKYLGEPRYDVLGITRTDNTVANVWDVSGRFAYVGGTVRTFDAIIEKQSNGDWWLLAFSWT